jgi:hypothetical protein
MYALSGSPSNYNALLTWGFTIDQNGFLNLNNSIWNTVSMFAGRNNIQDPSLYLTKANSNTVLLEILSVTSSPNSQIPEPESIALMGLGFLGMAAMRRKKV